MKHYNIISVQTYTRADLIFLTEQDEPLRVPEVTDCDQFIALDLFDTDGKSLDGCTVSADDGYTITDAWAVINDHFKQMTEAYHAGKIIFLHEGLATIYYIANPEGVGVPADTRQGIRPI